MERHGLGRSRLVSRNTAQAVIAHGGSWRQLFCHRTNSRASGGSSLDDTIMQRGPCASL